MEFATCGVCLLVEGFPFFLYVLMHYCAAGFNFKDDRDSLLVVFVECEIWYIATDLFWPRHIFEVCSQVGES